VEVGLLLREALGLEEGEREVLVLALGLGSGVGVPLPPGREGVGEWLGKTLAETLSLRETAGLREEERVALMLAERLGEREEESVVLEVEDSEVDAWEEGEESAEALSGSVAVGRGQDVGLRVGERLAGAEGVAAALLEDLGEEEALGHEEGECEAEGEARLLWLPEAHA
jgi:hypothetical protein